MSTPLKDFLAQREAELLLEIKELQEKLLPLETELSDVRKAQEAISSNKPVASALPDDMLIENALHAGKTMKELTLEALSEHFPSGATANKLIEFFQNRWGRTDILRSSLSPQLSRLKQDGLIRLRGKTWFISKSEKGPDAETSEPNSNAGDVAEERPNAPDLESGEGEASKPNTPSEGSNPSVSASRHRVGGNLLSSGSTFAYQPQFPAWKKGG